jgi:predicted ATP-dependent endonuclease of OLD family
MRLNEFRVQNYKTITDTGWVKVRPDVSCFLGKNESGKSAVMQAIWKFKNARGEGYDFLYDYPKERYSKDRGTDPIVTSLRFGLEQTEHDALVAARLPVPEALEVSTTYAGKRSYSLELPASPVAIPPIILELQQALSGHATEDSVEVLLDQARREVLPLSMGNQDAAVVRDAARKLKLVLPQIAVVLGERQSKFVAAVEALSAIRLPQETRALVEQWIEAHLPTFIYFDDYGRLETRINLQTFLAQRSATPVEPRVRTQMALFEWTHLNPEELQRLGLPIQPNETQEQVQRRKDERSSLTESASYNLTGEWMDWWDQRQHTLNIEADGDDLVLRVSDNQNPWKIPFHERSKGFQWFFSFYLTFLVESEKAHAGAILLLDEPGLHLHIRAQQKLLGFFQRISEKNQTIYSSHSPFMVDPLHLDNVRTVYLKKPEGSERVYTHVSLGTEPEGDRDTLLPLQAALGYEIAQTLFIGKRVLIVEGITDYCILQGLKMIFLEAGKTLLTDDIIILFAGGTSHMVPLVSLFAQPGATDRQLVVLLDGDKAGLEKGGQLRRELLPGGKAVALISDADMLGVPQTQVEDVIDRDELLAAVKKLKGSFNTPAKESSLNVPFMQQLYTENGWGDFTHERKVECLVAVVDGWRTKTTPASTSTLSRAETLLRGLAGRFV